MDSEDIISGATSSLPIDDGIYVQMNCYDSYMSCPTQLDSQYGSSLPLHRFESVPVIRVYGSLPTGHTVLCHVHGVFPYIYIRYDGNVYDSSLELNQRCARLHKLFEDKLKTSDTSSKRNKAKGSKTNRYGDGNRLKYIANVSIVKAIPFYGFNVGWSLFYKISLLNPKYSNKVSDLIRDGVMFDNEVETFESHIPYLLQFSSDYNLFGCSWIKLDKCYFRKPILNTILDLDKILNNEDLSSFIERFCDTNTLSTQEYPRIGNSLIEIDIIPQFIRNRDDLEFIKLHHDFIEKTNESYKHFKTSYVHSTKNLFKDIQRLRKESGLKPYEEPKPFERYEKEIIFERTAEYQRLYEKAASNSNNLKDEQIKFESFIYNDWRFDKIDTPSISVAELWPKLKLLKNDQADIKKSESNTNSRKDIDELINEYEEVNENSDSNTPIDIDEEACQDEKNELKNMLDEEDISSLPVGKIDNNSEIFSMDTFMTQTFKKRKCKKIDSTSNVDNNSKKLKMMNKNIGIKNSHNSLVFRSPPILFNDILNDLESEGYPKIDYCDPYFGNPIDLKDKVYKYAGKRFEIRSHHLGCKIPIQFDNEEIMLESHSETKYSSTWKYIPKPPSYNNVKTGSLKSPKKCFDSQIDKNYSINRSYLKSKNPVIPKVRKLKIHDVLTHFTLEVHTDNIGSKFPDPKNDSVRLIAWKIDDETYPFQLDVASEGFMIFCGPETEVSNYHLKRIEQAAGSSAIGFYETEIDMFDALIDLILFFDPDILSGFEVQSASWGYLIDRYRFIQKESLLEELSRVSIDEASRYIDKWGSNRSSGVKVTGRHIINIWRAMRASTNFNQYTIENLCSKLLNKRLPHFSFSDLSKMWNGNDVTEIKTVMSYWMTRVRCNMLLLKKQEYITRVTEQSRLIGIDFYSVYYRGSQYNVESFLIRLCKSEEFLLVSPSKEKVRDQRSLECVPLIMEPESAFYKSPLLVLDFQSLYPSIMIAYNYCYSTMLGRVEDLKPNGNQIGATTLSIPNNLLKLLKDDIQISPNGVVFLKSTVRKSILSKMLTDILKTRVMVKNTMSELQNVSSDLNKIMNNRQLALKLLANVTYGYSSASFSGRMPCSDLADSIVQTGRDTLQNAINLIESNDNWGAKVVYGDTDSLFVYLPGKSREESFKIGRSIVEEVTKQNPDPIILKFEKVYHPCLLLSKKRYVGYSFEKESQKEPIFDAKGIETVRRDGHAAQQYIVEKSIRLLFETKNLSKISEYLLEQFARIETGSISIQDFCFAKEAKLGTYKSEKSTPAGAIVAMRAMENDHRAKPQYKERVPYLIVKGKQGQILRERGVSPEEFLKNPNLELDAEYYIMKTLIPPLDRIFNILGVSVKDWISASKKNLKLDYSRRNTNTLSNVKCMTCINCKEKMAENKTHLCVHCNNEKPTVSVQLLQRQLRKQERLKKTLTACRICSYKYTHDAGIMGSAISVKCNSYDCPVYYSRIKLQEYFHSEEYKTLVKTLDLLDNDLW
ncbi:hypothetical protein Kpol_1013p17 [Vanderwaltozyma polyspora DSM 70294]|uniref:DNA polymerase n=1 Tax=Vanderwaltozyma polyspora (strain ATCC 22028 / DSM 70294 / BCRC 21397 / CBS 2163 / NBRC 10782 / NRRL Y-8283 / UCD 57-17) TaxID=436907 RepID=A7TH65_VANPO|nr:uncharacterized protein Kpol_1013p17 [Vanderwaltozyma polyspora DSM 70294]EDO18346.1 hypothetical protein Kpol_1013p17 [Vanderwaltozyma polyspora DSM 70294]